MEKRQLVRTFGTALATATLSFGLFAAPAIADPSAKSAGEANVRVDGVTNNTAIATTGAAGDAFQIRVPVTVNEITAAELDGTDASTTTLTDYAKITLSATRGGKTQELDLACTGVFEDEDCTTAVKTTADLYKKVWLTFGGNVWDDMVNGDWSAEKLTIYLQSEPEAIVVDISGAKLSKGGDMSLKAEDQLGPVFVDGSLEVYRPIVSSKQDNTLTVRFEDPAATPALGSEAQVYATYKNAGGWKMELPVLNNTAIAGGTNAQIYEAKTSLLPIRMQGSHELTELVARHLISGSVPANTWGLYDVDYYGDLEAGDYLVGEGLYIPIFRAYNKNDGQHLYTDSEIEVAAAIEAGWKDEGIAWYAPADYWDRDTKQAVYRLYNPYNGEHHFTTGNAEALTMIANGWTDEGVGFNSLVANAIWNGTPAAAPVYRLFNPYVTVGTHHYTTSLTEYNKLGDAGWNKEEIGWYAVDLDALR